MTVEQVADYLQLNKLTVYRYVREGRLPAVRLGKTYRIRRTEVDAFLESHMVPSVRSRGGLPHKTPTAAQRAAMRHEAEERQARESRLHQFELRELRERREARDGTPAPPNLLDWAIRELH